MRSTFGRAATLLLCALVARATAATAPRELREAAARIDREVRKLRAPVEAARRRLDKTTADLTALQARLAVPPAEGEEPDEAAKQKLSAERDRLEKQRASLTAKIAEAEKTAEPADAPARALAEYARGSWAKARDLAESAHLPGVEKELAYLAALARLRAGDLAGGVAKLDTPELASLGESQRFLGVARFHLGERDRAEQHLARAHLRADDGEAHAALGELYLAGKKTREAAEELDKAVRATPGDPRLLGLLGRAQLELGRNADAARTLDRLLKLAPRDREAAYLIAVARSRAGDGEAAERALARYLEKTRRASGDARYERPGLAPWIVPTFGFESLLPVAPDEAAARNQMAVYLAERGEYEQARRELDAVAVDEGRALYHRGLIELAAGRFAQARAALEKAAKALPDKPGPPQALGALATMEGDARAAEAAFTEAGRRAPTDPLPAIGLAVARALAGQPADAEKRLRPLVDKPGRAGAAARVNLASLALQGGRPEAAREALSGACGDGERAAEACFVKARAAEALAAVEEAQADFGRAVTLAPNYFDALTALGRVSEQRGDHAAARAALDRAIALHPEVPEPHALLARALAGLGDEKAAIAESDLARRLEPKAKADAAATKPEGGAKLVAVTAFDNTLKSAPHAWLSVGIAEALASDLPKLGGVRVVERAQLQKAFDELRLAQLAAPDAQSAPEVGKIVGADALVVGSFQIVGPNIRLLGRLVAVKDGQVLRAGESQGALDDLFTVERKLALDLLSDYAKTGAGDREAFFRAQAPAMAGLEAVARAQVALARGDSAEAKAQLARAGAADASFASTYADLKKSADASANLAVLPLANASKRPADEWLAAGIAEALSGDLRKLGVPQVERLAIDRVLGEKRFQELFSGDGSDAKQAKEAGRQLGAKALVIGSFQASGTTLRIDARLVDADSNAVLLADHVEGEAADLFKLETQLAVALGKKLNPHVTDGDAAGLADAHPSPAEFAAQQKARAATVAHASSERKAQEATPREVASQLENAHAIHASTASAAPPAPPQKTAVPALLETRVVDLGGGRVRIEARILDLRSNRVLAQTFADGARGDTRALQQQVAQNLAGTLSSLPPVPPAGAAP